MEYSRVKIEVYCPKSYLEVLREAMSGAGAGIVGQYDHVSSVQEVTGSWRPLPGSNPYDGKVGVLSTEPECKLEMPCAREHVAAVAAAIRAVHPYEEPLFYLIPVLDA